MGFKGRAAHNPLRGRSEWMSQYTVDREPPESREQWPPNTDLFSILDLDLLCTNESCWQFNRFPAVLLIADRQGPVATAPRVSFLWFARWLSDDGPRYKIKYDYTGGWINSTPCIHTLDPDKALWMAGVPHWVTAGLQVQWICLHGKPLACIYRPYDTFHWYIPTQRAARQQNLLAPFIGLSTNSKILFRYCCQYSIPLFHARLTHPLVSWIWICSEK